MNRVDRNSSDEEMASSTQRLEIETRSNSAFNEADARSNLSGGHS